MTHPNPARAILIRFECREQCAEKGEPPCFELDAREGNDAAPAPCDLCQRLTDARLAALAKAGMKCLGREPAEAMLAADFKYGNNSLWTQIWRAMWDSANPAASEPEQSETPSLADRAEGK